MSFSSELIQPGKEIPTFDIGNSYKISESISLTSCSVSSRQLTGITGTPYLFESNVQSSIELFDLGSTQFISTTNGLSRALSSSITRSSASSYSSRGMELIEPSVVITRPIVECSVITFFVPISAAILSSTASSGMNLGSVVIMVLPAADCGNSSIVRSLTYGSPILGITSVSIKRFIKVDLPDLTGPTTPI